MVEELEILIYRICFFLINLLCGIFSILILNHTLKTTTSIVLKVGLVSFIVVSALQIILSYLIFMPHGYSGYIFADFLMFFILFGINIVTSLFITQFFYTWRFVGSEVVSNILVGFQVFMLLLFVVFLFINPGISFLIEVLNIPWMICSEIALEVLYTRGVNRMLHTIGYDMDEMLTARDLAYGMLRAKVGLALLAIPGCILFFQFFVTYDLAKMGLGWILLTLCMVWGCILIDKKVKFLELINGVKKEDIALDSAEILTTNYSIE
eukprot:NODE_331_length_10750_cov_0.204676.p2 type:complete len:266 gc:universal NODE_331_length_10750_cov_0.204676:1923-1126(-)